MSRGPSPILLVLAMSLPGAARALGLGDIRVDSALNEPLSAQIDIVGATREELIGLTARIANREVFTRYGADHPGFLSSATFKVGMDSQGRPVLNVRSAEAFTDPVVSFLVDLRWNNGELIREYSLLLDPAGFAPSRLAAEAAMAAAPAGARPYTTSTSAPASTSPTRSTSATSSTIPAASTGATSATPSAASPGTSSAMPQAGPAAPTTPTTDEPLATASVGTVSSTQASKRPNAKRSKGDSAAAQPPLENGSKIRVAAGDTLRSIVRRAGARTEPVAQRMMIAILRTNPQAFEGNNINVLRLGAVLTMPSDETVAAIDTADARREVRAQMTAWRLDGRPASSRSASPAADTVGTLQGRLQSLEHALEDMHKQLSADSATIADLKQLTAERLAPRGATQSGIDGTGNATAAVTPLAAAMAPAGAATPATSSAPAAAVAVPTASGAAVSSTASAKIASSAASVAATAPPTSALASTTDVTAPGSLASPATPASSVAPPAAANPHPPVSIEVMHDAAHAAPKVVVAPPPVAPHMSVMSLIGPVAFCVALVVAAGAYARRRILKARNGRAATPELDEFAPLIGNDADFFASTQSVPPSSPPPTAEAPVPAAAARAAPIAAASATIVQEILAHEDNERTTQEMAIDIEALENSYLDALKIDSLGIDAADTAKHAVPSDIADGRSELADGSDAGDTAKTAALDAAEFNSAMADAELNSLMSDAPAVQPVDSTTLDYNLVDLDATVEHHAAQHVQMPSQLHDHAMVSERRMNIIDVLKTAIDRDPSRRDLRMKLLETYYNAASINRRAFLEVVKKTSREREFLSADDWKMVVKMGTEIAPEDIMFANPLPEPTAEPMADQLEGHKGDLADCA